MKQRICRQSYRLYLQGSCRKRLDLSLAGCQNTPAKESRYCSLHDKHAASFKDDMAINQNQHAEEDSTLIIKILNKKTTRQDNFYEVRFITNNG